MIVPTLTNQVIDLPAFIRFLESELDVNDEESILAAAPKLLALCKNRRFLAEYLVQNLDSPTFQAKNAYGESAFVLAHDLKRGFMIRVVGWRPEAGSVTLTPSGHSGFGYRSESLTLAHTHNFSLLTAGYHGSGYETELYGVPADTFDRNIGDRVEMVPLGRQRLALETIMYYPALEVAHIQYPPDDYSISLNLITRAKNRFADQCFIDLRDSTLARKSNGTIGFQCSILELAGQLPSPEFVPLLERIAGHPVARVKEKAAQALESCRAAGRDSP